MIGNAPGSPSRPYARKRGGPPSVTTIIGCLDKPGLPWGAAKETATFAVKHQDQWRDLDDDTAIDRLYRHHRGVWDSRAAIGTAVHNVNQAWCFGQDADYPAEADGYVAGLERFWADWEPDWQGCEYVVRHPDRQNSYIGTADGLAVLADGQRWLLDIKTTANQDETKGLYPDTWRLQGAAYRFADEIVCYDDKGAETGTLPNLKADEFGVIHLRGDGLYTLFQMVAGRTEFNCFLSLRRLWTWVNREAKDPAPVPLISPAKAQELLSI